MQKSFSWANRHLSSGSCRALLILSSLALSTSCGPEKGTYVDLRLSGKPSQTLIASASIDGIAFGAPIEFSGDSKEIVLRFPEKTSGRLKLDIEGFTNDTCVESVGAGEITLLGKDLYSLDVDIKKYLLASCPSSGSAINKIIAFDATDAWAVGSNGTVLRWDGIQWDSSSTKNLFATGSVNGIWGRSSDDLYLVGTKGTIVRQMRSSTSLMNSTTNETLLAIAGSERDGSAWAVGEHGTIVRMKDGMWTAKWPSGQPWTPPGLESITLRDVTMFADGNAYAVGDNGTILHLEPTSSMWTKESSGVTANLYKIQGKGNSLWAVGTQGTVLRYSQGTWTTVKATINANSNYYSLALVTGDKNYALLGGDKGLFSICQYSDIGNSAVACTHAAIDPLVTFSTISTDGGHVWLAGGAQSDAPGMGRSSIFRF